jgi:hypothetical protein
MAEWSSLSAFLPARWALPGGFGLCFLLGTIVFVGHNGAHNVTQPIVFNHAKHLANGLSCTDCHVGVETQAHATLPTMDTCIACHATALTESAEEQKIRTLATEGKGLAWVRITRVPTHVYFSHRRHVTLAKLTCATCHGPMEKATVPPSRPYREFTMDTCIECHENNRGGTDCNDCHR